MIYSQEHAENGHLNVFLWIQPGNDAGNEKGISVASGSQIMHTIWNTGTDSLEIKAAGGTLSTASGSSGVRVMQLPAMTRIKKAQLWIETPAGQEWSRGKPAYLVVVTVDGGKPGNGVYK